MRAHKELPYGSKIRGCSYMKFSAIGHWDDLQSATIKMAKNRDFAQAFLNAFRRVIPTKPVREMSELTSYKRKVIEQKASEKNRIHKFLENSNIKLSSVVSKLSRATATKIIDSTVGGKEDIKELVKLRHGKMNVTIEDYELVTKL